MPQSSALKKSLPVSKKAIIVLYRL